MFRYHVAVLAMGISIVLRVVRINLWRIILRRLIGCIRKDQVVGVPG